MSSFDRYAGRYDAWFDSAHGEVLFANEVAALRLLWRKSFLPALEIGVGTGRFAAALGIGHGIDPSECALALARSRGIDARCGRGEKLPLADGSFQAVALITSLGFTGDPAAVLREVTRVLRPDGHVLIGDIPRDSLWGRNCLQKKSAGDPFFADLRSLTVDEIVGLLREAGFEPEAFASTLITSTPDAPQPEPPRFLRSEDAGFVGILAAKG